MGNNIYREYCTGCGLCENNKYTKLEETANGLLFPSHVNEKMESFCDEVCPMSSNLTVVKNLKNIWGQYRTFNGGYATNSLIRAKASSGGVITALCCWLLENNVVDGIIQTTYNPQNPMDTITVISADCESVISCSGSRYSGSTPLRNIADILIADRRYAFVGKPCDVSALSNYIIKYPQLNKKILYMFSFFCAGTPSPKANERLLGALGIKKGECKALSYRGDGWPGRTKAIDVMGNEHTMTYQKAWMDILGRDIRLSCKFCFDSIGEKSDISCGDFWFLDKKMEPDFSEHDGRNCVFSWTEKGEKLLLNVAKDGIIALEDADIKWLNNAQPNHFNRRSTMLTKILVMKIAHKKVPNYKLNILLKYARFASFKAHMHAAKGTITRIMNGGL